MTLAPLLGAAAQGEAKPTVPSTPGLLAIRARRAETISHGLIEYAVILIENGKIAAVGPDLPIERGIPVVDLPDEWTVMPGLVDAYSRVGLDGEGYTGSRPDVLASAELYPAAEVYADVLEKGVTTLGQYPAGNDLPGQAVAIRPAGKTTAEMILRDKSYLKLVLRANAASKKLLSDGFKKVDEHIEKEKKNREKWDADQEKKKKSASKSEKETEKKETEKKDGEEKKEDEKKETEKKDEAQKDEEKKDEKKPEAGADEYKPLEIDPKTLPFFELREGKLRALVSIANAGEYLHLIDAIGEEKFEWDLRIPLTRDIDIFNVTDKIGERKLRIVCEPSITLQPGTMRQRNLPAELSRAGAKIVFVPRTDATWSMERWLRDVGEISAAGLDRQVALRAVTQEPADLLGVGERVGSLDAGKDANLLILRGDPLETGTRVQAVILEGRIVFGEVNP